MNAATSQNVQAQRVSLFTRDQETVRLLVQPAPDGFQLVIFGPGSASTAFEFAEMQNLERFREKYQQDLVVCGFTPHAVAERRTRAVSPAATRPENERRR